MKLEYTYEENKNIKKIFKIIAGISVFVVIAIICLCAIAVKDGYNLRGILDTLLTTVGIFLMAPGIVALSFLGNSMQKRIDEECIAKGIKVRGKILHTNSNCVRSSKIPVYGLDIFAQDRIYTAKYVAYNAAYKTLEKYLENNRYGGVEIEVYVYNDKIYADLSTVDMDDIVSRTAIKYN